ncbi:MAG: hypothetical protein WKF84_03015 [Pyrinomonadaceae bacterium]
MFANNPSQAVNGSLWTLCYEFTCYIGIVLLSVAGMLKRRELCLLIYFLTLAIWLSFSTEISRYSIPGTEIVFSYVFSLSLYFGAGALCYLYEEKIKYSPRFAFILLILVFLSFALSFDAITLSFIVYPYILLTFVFTPNRFLGQIGKWGDFSYGTYIYSYPIQQMIISIASVNIPVSRMILLSFIFTVPFAALSWFVVEKPALRLKDRWFPPTHAVT